MSLKSEDAFLENVVRFDEFGFAIFKEGSTNAEDDDRCHDFRDLSALKKDKTWNRILSNLDNQMCLSPQNVRIAIKHGVPSHIRGDLWNRLLDATAIKANNSFDYQSILDEIRSLLVDLGISEYGGKNCIQRLGQVLGKLNIINDNDDSPESIQTRSSAKAEIHHKLTILRQIMLDLDRSFPTHRSFMDGTSEGQEGRASLFRVLAVYSQYNKAVSYCQGMSYIAGMLLMNMDEEKAFWCLVSLFERPKYLMGYFDDSLSKIQRHALVFEALMKQRKNKLYKHLQKQGINPLMYLTPWFMALFTSLPCWDTVLFIWDLMVLEGVSVIFQVALSILEVLEESLMKSTEMCHCLPTLLHPPAELTSRSILVPVISRVKVQKWEIDSIQDVLDEEEDKRVAKNNKRSLNINKENMPTYKKFKKSSDDGGKKATSVLNEPPIINRIVDYITNPLRTAIFGNNDSQSNQGNEIEMVTFSKRSYQSPPVAMGMCCSSGHSPMTTNMLLEFPMRNSFNSPLSPEALKRSVRRNHVSKRLGSPVRRSPRLLAKQRMKAFNTSTSSLVGRSARNQHSFKEFNTPTPLRPTKFDIKTHRVNTFSPQSSNSSVFSPEMLFAPDVELMEISQPEKKLNFDAVL